MCAWVVGDAAEKIGDFKNPPQKISSFFKLEVDMKLGDMVKFNKQLENIHKNAVGIIIKESHTSTETYLGLHKEHKQREAQYVTVYWMDINETHEELERELEVISECTV